MVLEKVKKIISDQLNVDISKIDLNTTFEEMNADSIDLVELVMSFEEEFAIKITDEEIDKIKTVGDIIEYIKSAR